MTQINSINKTWENRKGNNDQQKLLLVIIEQVGIRFSYRIAGGMGGTCPPSQSKSRGRGEGSAPQSG